MEADYSALQMWMGRGPKLTAIVVSVQRSVDGNVAIVRSLYASSALTRYLNSPSWSFDITK